MVDKSLKKDDDDDDGVVAVAVNNHHKLHHHAHRCCWWLCGDDNDDDKKPSRLSLPFSPPPMSTNLTSTMLLRFMNFDNLPSSKAESYQNCDCCCDHFDNLKDNDNNNNENRTFTPTSSSSSSFYVVYLSSEEVKKKKLLERYSKRSTSKYINEQSYYYFQDNNALSLSLNTKNYKSATTTSAYIIYILLVLLTTFLNFGETQRIFISSSFSPNYLVNNNNNNNSNIFNNDVIISQQPQESRIRIQQQVDDEDSYYYSSSSLKTYARHNHQTHHHHTKRNNPQDSSISSSFSSYSSSTLVKSSQNDPIHDQPQSDSPSSIVMTSSSSTSLAIVSYITPNKSINFTHIELDPVTGTVYVGAVNWIFQLHSESLRVQHAVRTGPIRDSIYCTPTDCSGILQNNNNNNGGGGASVDDSDNDNDIINNANNINNNNNANNNNNNVIQVMNNVNKILLVEPYARMLIICGSVHQGACARHRLEDISTHEDLVPIPVAANDENSSTVAFVGPARYFGVQLTPILYVAATDTRLGPYRDVVPSISGRSLESGSRLFNIIDRSFTDSARVDILFHLRDYFQVRYIYGFHSGDYVYMTQVQRRSYLRAHEELGYVSRLSRVCVSDAGFHTYAEITLECSNVVGESGRRSYYNHRHQHRHRTSSISSESSSSATNTSKGVIEEFNLLQDAILMKAGADLADSLNIERGSQVLIGVFSTSIDAHTSRPGARSAVCLYPVADIEQRFAENIHLCYNGSVYSRNMDYIAGGVNQCPEPGVS